MQNYLKYGKPKRKEILDNNNWREGGGGRIKLTVRIYFPAVLRS